MPLAGGLCGTRSFCGIPAQRRFQVGNQIPDNSHRKPNQAIIDPDLRPPLGGDAGVGHQPGMLDQALDAPKALGEAESRSTSPWLIDYLNWDVIVEDRICKSSFAPSFARGHAQRAAVEKGSLGPLSGREIYQFSGVRHDPSKLNGENLMISEDSN
jgi:hypothetical protein